MAKLSIRLFGPFQAELDGESLEDFRSDKVRGLLAFLSVESHRPWTRSYLADLLWTDLSEIKAQSNLSNALWNLRSVIEDDQKGTEFIIVEKTSLQFNLKADYWLDVKAFHELIEKSQKSTSTYKMATMAKLDEALSLSSGDFMEGFSINSPSFETWLVKTRQEIHQKRIQALSWISSLHDQAGRFAKALDYTQDWITEEPWDEQAYRQVMRILVKLGQRKRALEQFEACRHRLVEDLGIEPQQETLQLYRQIQEDSLPPASKTKPAIPTTLKKQGLDSGPPPEFLTRAVLENVVSKPFFGRQAELAQLDKWLDEILGKQGKVAFVKGEPGSGKTYLLSEFAKHALTRNPNLLLFKGQCNAFIGHGDPYFPFITITRMLAGNFEPLIPNAIINLEHLERLWRFLPVMLECLVNFGPDLSKRHFTDNHQLLLLKAHPGLTESTLESIEQKMKLPEKKQYRQAALNDQFNQVLSALSKEHPILLVLDDLQWIDDSSASLLFHLGHQSAGKNILLLGAFRSEEVEILHKEKTHPLIGIIGELTAIYGKNLINLAESEGKTFLNDLLRSEPNAFTPSFSQMLYLHTTGHPLFAVELLRGMQLRSEIYKDNNGNWVESDHLNWGELPARVEAVIMRRFRLLPAECQSLMNAACVQGESFSVEVLSQVLNMPSYQVYNLLSEEVCKRHRLILPEGVQKVGEQRLTSFRFRHMLFQIYLYNQLNKVEKIQLHGLIGETLENFYQDNLKQHPEMAHHLARHFELAGLPAKAIQYYQLAGENAMHLTAHQDAMRHYKHALLLLKELPESTQRNQLEFDLQLKLGPPLTALKGWGAPELEKAYDRAQVLIENIKNPEKLIPALWLLATFRLGRSEHREVDQLVGRLVNLTQKINDPALNALSYLQVSPLYQGRFIEGKRLLERAAAVQDVNLQRHLAHRFGMAPAAVALCYLSNCLWMMGNPDQADKIDQEAFDFAEKVNHPMTSCYVTSRTCWLGLIKDNPAQASRNSTTLFQISQKYGFKNFELTAIFFENYVKLAEGKDSIKIIDAMQQILLIYNKTRTILNQTAFLLLFAKACLTAGQILRGLDAIEQCLIVGENTGELWLQAEAWRIKGELLLISKNTQQAGEEKTADALNCFWNAYRVSKTQGAKLWELRAAMSIADILSSQNQTVEARKILNETYQWFTEGFNTRDLKEAQNLLDSLL
ncbi:MAG: BTAD domain-containing putative transcriptional regulator [Brevefilum sp.]|nr:BTAD domain-containing putative transcriptional regulator [Brevefilum sp.]